ncbi:DUF4440 domain-containing protein [Geobacter chapellei]|uniref:DUF4440 domain-containing protein n=1 Tax=Pelotalea chapellei TaxID=44671 RepID=A0ABS5UAH7_9BACT|nr:nuclear transport factor 2 family protein [Pelotalea chapellei]MBT1072638.1 DUF4440 domain-containing protein [Pelotalea chapellei]
MQVLQVRSQALNGRDLPLYLSVVSPAYRDKGKDIAALTAGVAAGFKSRTVAYQAGHRTVSVSGNRAEVKGTYRMKVTVGGREMVLDGEETIILSREAGVWKIIAGL